MKIYLNAGFGAPIGDADLQMLRDRKFAGCRNDIPEHFPPDVAKAMVTEQREYGLRPLFLVNGGYMPWGPEHTVSMAVHVAQVMETFGVEGEIEIGNEPDISRYKGDPKAVGRMVKEAHSRIRDSGINIRLVLGGIMTTSRDKLKYLEEMVSVGLPGDVIVGYHTYRQWKEPSEAEKGFRTREEEFERLHEICAGREMWNTEIGWHTAKEKRFFCTRQLTDQQVLDRLCAEYEYNLWAGAKVMTMYQLNDGPGDEALDLFGIRYVDRMTYKPSATVPERMA